MQAWEILKADVLDILFDNRNKLYGAYALRRHYPSRLKMALGLTLLSSFMMSLLFRNSQESIIYEDREKPMVHLIDLPPLPPLPKPPETPPVVPKRAQSSYSNKMKIVDRPDDERMMKTIDEISTTTIGGENVEGPTDMALPNTPAEPPSVTAAVPDKPDTPAFEAREQQPEFPGGAQAWLRFLNRNLQTPSDLEPGEKKTVLIKFIVDVSGTVTDFTVVRSGGYAFDNEVIRVLRKMPKWKPAVQNGHPVTVSFTQPVTFVGLEE